MERNIKIKHAVTAALSLMAFSFHSTSFALGLSDITIESNLGEALKAHVNIVIFCKIMYSTVPAYC